MANRKPNHLLVQAAVRCGPHLTYRDAIMALRTHSNPIVYKHANGCKVVSLENRLRPWGKQMMRGPTNGIEFMHSAPAAILRYLELSAPHVPGDDPEIAAARDELLRMVRAMNRRRSGNRRRP